MNKDIYIYIYNNAIMTLQQGRHPQAEVILVKLWIGLQIPGGPKAAVEDPLGGRRDPLGLAFIFKAISSGIFVSVLLFLSTPMFLLPR